MSKKYLGIDIGTSGCKLVLIDENGLIIKQVSSGYDFCSPQPGWAEQDPEIWLIGLKDCLHQLGESKIDAIGLTGQMHGAVCLDKSGKVLRPAILWNDQRTISQSAEMDLVCGKDSIRKITCNPPLTGFQAPKLLWIKENEPEIYSKINHVLLPKDYIRYRLTGKFASDFSDASGTALFDVPKRNWSRSLIEKLELDGNWFPAAYESTDQTAETLAESVTGLRLERGIPVFAGAGDQAAGAVGTGTIAPGTVSISLGTSGVVFCCLETPSYHPDGRTHTFCHANGKWHAMSVMLSCGGAVSWLQKSLFPEASYQELDSWASPVKSGSDGLVFLPYLTGERSPINDPFAKGIWAGLTARHSRGHLVRSVLEGTCFGLRAGWEALQDIGATGNTVRVTSGGSKSQLWVQILANTLQMPCEILSVDEGPAFGAAILAAIGVGGIGSFESSVSMNPVKQSLAPNELFGNLEFEKYKALYEDTKDWMKQP